MVVVEEVLTEADIRDSSSSSGGSGRSISRNGGENLKLSHFRLLLTGVLTIQLWKGEQMIGRVETKWRRRNLF